MVTELVEDPTELQLAGLKAKVAGSVAVHIFQEDRSIALTKAVAKNIKPLPFSTPNYFPK